MFLSKSLLLLTVLACCQGALELGKYLKVCSRNSVDVNDCLVDAIQDGIDKMSDGIKDLGVPPLDPYKQKELRVDYKNNQINVRMILKNIQVIGLKNAKVHDVRLKADEDQFHLEVDLTSPSISVTGEYEGSGQYNSLKINADGLFTNAMTDLVYTWKLDGIPEKNGTDTYVRATDFYMRPDVGNMMSNLTNNNPESKELTDLGVRFMNENWRPLYRELLPYAQANWDKIGVRVSNKIFQKIPYDQVFPNES